MQVVGGDLRGGLGAWQAAAEEGCQGVPPDGASDRKADEALNRCCLCEPVLDLLGGGAAAEQDAGDTLSPRAAAGLGGEHLGVGALIHAFDLPDVDLDPEVLDLGDRAPHQLGSQFGVVTLAATCNALQL